MNSFALSGFLTGIASLAMGGFVLAKAPEKSMSRIWFGFTLAVAVWGFVAGGIGLDRDPASSFLAWRLSYAFGVSWIPVLFYHFVLHLCRLQDDPVHKKRLLAQYLIAAVWVPILLFSQSALAGVRPFPQTTFYYAIAGPLLWPYLLWWLGLTIHVHWLVFQIYRHAGGAQRNQLRYFFAAFLLAYGTGSLCYLPTFGIDVYPYGNFGIMFYPIIVTYAIGAYRLMDIQTVIHKTAAWLTVSSLVAVPLFGIFYLGHPSISNLSRSETSLLLALIALMVIPYVRWITPRIDHLFHRRHYDLQKILQGVVTDLAELKDLNVLIEKIANTIQETLYVSKITLLLWDDKARRFRRVKGETTGEEEPITLDPLFLSWMKEQGRVIESEALQIDTQQESIRPLAQSYFKEFDAEVCLPLIHDGRLIGLVNLGQKDNLQSFSRLDIDFLSTLRVEAAITMSNSLLYDDVRKMSLKLKLWASELEQKVEERTLNLADANEALQQSHERLEERVVERTAELTAMNKDLESFTYTVSHDLRAPIRALLGYAHLLVKDHADRLNDEGRRFLSIFQQESAHMGNLIDDLLDFSRLGRIEINRTLIDMNRLVRAVVDHLRALEPARSLTVTISELPPLIGDPVLLRQAFINLIGNAFKFTGKNGVATPAREAMVTIGWQSSESDRVYFVADNGVGFDTRYIAKLFTVFERLHTTDEFPGTGVGLAIVQRVIEKHGGRVWAESKLGEGATFYLALPVTTPAPQTTDTIILQVGD